MLTLSGFNKILTKCPPMLNILSEDTLDAHTKRYLCATTERRDIRLHSSIHQSKGDSLMSKVRYCTYMSISRLTFSDTPKRLSVLCAPQFDEIFPKIALNLPVFFDGPGKSSLLLSVLW